MGPDRSDYRAPRRRLTSASVPMRPERLVSAILVTAVFLLIVNGAAFFAFASEAGTAAQFTMVMLTLNVALILVGWRRLADVQHEAERRIEAERQAAHIASTDSITGLANRKGLADRGSALRERLAASGGWLAVMSLRMHRFKAINDRHGYEAGDAMLRNLALAINASVPPGGLAARLNGDEFAVVMPVDAEDGGQAERMATDILRRVTAPFDIGGKMLQVGAYAGIASAAAETTALPDLLRRADIALDRARSGRVARPVWFDEGMERALMAHVEVEQGIRHGLEHQQFVPYFEPQVDLTTGEVVGFEMLARWKHPLSGLILPDTFIPVAEEHGLIARLSEQVIGQALSAAAPWGDLMLAVNISPSQLADPWLAQRLMRMLVEAGFPPERLVVEITESSLFADLDLARSITANLKNQGIRLALDDFGTGYSSLSHLRSLPFDIIKIDRSFVANLTTDPESAAIVRAVNDLARAINVPVMVEGIEDAATHSAVLGFGCTLGQGWYFGKPMGAEQAGQIVTRVPDPAAVRRAS